MAGLLGGLFGGGGDDAPKANTPAMSEATQNLISRSAKEGEEKTPEQFAQERMAGVESAAKLPSFEGVRSSEAGMGMGNQAALKAIHGRQASLLSKDLNRMKNQASIAGQQDKLLATKRAQVHLQAQQNVASQAHQAQMAAYNAEKQARGGVLRSVLGLAGTVGGMLVGGPAGAAIGGQVGGMLGGGAGGGGGSLGPQMTE